MHRPRSTHGWAKHAGRWLFASLAALSLCGPAAAQKQGGSITVGLELDVAGFDPLKVGVYDTSGFMVAAALFDTLTGRDADGKATPRLALSWTHADDYKTWTFKLRPDVKFHDGTPFNAQAVKWNFDRQKDPANKCRCAFYIAFIDSVEVADVLTVVYHLKDPLIMLPEVMAPPTQNNVVQSPSAVAAKGDDYNRNPVGTGPFMLKSWTGGDRIVVERNPNYWNAGHPHLDRIVFKPLPDAQSRFASLQSGEADLVWDDEYDYDSILKARTDKRLAVHTHVGSGAQVYVFNTKVAPFDDLRVRQALVMALDRKKMSQAITGGLARPALNPYGDGSWVKCSDDGALPYDPAKARELLKAYGKRVAFRAIFTATPGGRADRSGSAAVLEAGRRDDGDRPGGPGVDRSACIPAPVPDHPVAHHRSRRPGPADVRQLPHGQSGGAGRLLQPGTRPDARAGARDPGHAQPNRRLLRDWSPDESAGDLVMDLPDQLLRDLECKTRGPAPDVQRHHRRFGRLARIAVGPTPGPVLALTSR
jgi:4-phytase/acid phosphatase/peptide/nickel transport system substrate-binding protein